MARVYLYRSGFCFLPAYSSDTDILSQFREGEVIAVEVKKARNYNNHKRFFALLKLGFEAQNNFTSPDWFREFILIKSGNFESCQTPDGFMYRAKSISFANMDEVEFRELYRTVSQTIIDYCKVSQKDIENNLNLFT
jgi:hypothetical protein